MLHPDWERTTYREVYVRECVVGGGRGRGEGGSEKERETGGGGGRQIHRERGKGLEKTHTIYISYHQRFKVIGQSAHQTNFSSLWPGLFEGKECQTGQNEHTWDSILLISIDKSSTHALLHMQGLQQFLLCNLIQSRSQAISTPASLIKEPVWSAQLSKDPDRYKVWEILSVRATKSSLIRGVNSGAFLKPCLKQHSLYPKILLKVFTFPTPLWSWKRVQITKVIRVQHNSGYNHGKFEKSV